MDNQWLHLSDRECIRNLSNKYLIGWLTTAVSWLSAVNVQHLIIAEDSRSYLSFVQSSNSSSFGHQCLFVLLEVCVQNIRELSDCHCVDYSSSQCMYFYAVQQYYENMVNQDSYAVPA